MTFLPLNYVIFNDYSKLLNSFNYRMVHLLGANGELVFSTHNKNCICNIEHLTETDVKWKSGPEVKKNFFMLNSTKYEFFPAYNVKMPTGSNKVMF